MSGLLKKLEDRIESRIKERIGSLEPYLQDMVKLLKQIEKNTRKD